MSAITTIASGDLITNSRANINDNFSNLNADKVETSVLDTDTTLAANSDSKVATQKATKAYIDAQTLLSLDVETTTGTTHSLTTVADQKVIVWVKGNNSATANAASITVKYGGVTKDTVASRTASGSSDKDAFSLMYTETPGAATADIVVATTNGTLENVVIIVMKI